MRLVLVMVQLACILLFQPLFLFRLHCLPRESLKRERVSGAPSILLEAICESLERERVSGALSVLLDTI